MHTGNLSITFIIYPHRFKEKTKIKTNEQLGTIRTACENEGLAWIPPGANLYGVTSDGIAILQQYHMSSLS